MKTTESKDGGARCSASPKNVSNVCGNCRYYEIPKPNNVHGLCGKKNGDFVGTLRPLPRFRCGHFEITVARRMDSI